MLVGHRVSVLRDLLRVRFMATAGLALKVVAHVAVLVVFVLPLLAVVWRVENRWGSLRRLESNTAGWLAIFLGMLRKDINLSVFKLVYLLVELLIVWCAQVILVYYFRRSCFVVAVSLCVIFKITIELIIHTLATFRIFLQHAESPILFCNELWAYWQRLIIVWFNMAALVSEPGVNGFILVTLLIWMILII